MQGKKIGLAAWPLAFAAAVVFLVSPAAAQRYKQFNLVSDIPGKAAHTDSHLVNSWGIVRSSTGPFWVADNGTGVSTLYNGSGQAFPTGSPLVVTIPPVPGSSASATPTGVVFNGENDDFDVTPGHPAIFIFVTEDGTISAWNPSVSFTQAILKVNNSSKAVYKGAALAKIDKRRFLYAANFRSGKVDVFDATYHQIPAIPGLFEDHSLPTGFAPFNIQNVGGRLFVTFAKQDATKHDEVDGAGLGYVDVFTPSGVLTMRLQHGSWLNAPWAVVQAPSDFGLFSADLIVGNFGSGQLGAFDPVTGHFLGMLLNQSGNPVHIDGLWGLTFGNGSLAGVPNILYFAAGINHEADGLFGGLQALP